MGVYTYVIGHAWVHTPEEVNALVEDEDFPSLTNAEQIISIGWDAHHNAYLVCWRVRKWLRVRTMPKTPDETKKGLECCGTGKYGNHNDCPYDISGPKCMQNLLTDALALIQQLQAENAELSGKIGQLEVERDAAVKDLHYLVNHPQSAGPCYACKHNDECCTGGDCDPVENDRWEWRGVQGES